MTADGRPFFWLGDTAWELFHRLTREDAERYLQNRAGRRFTMIQAVALAEFDGLTQPNAYGHTPLRDNDPTSRTRSTSAHVDWIVNRANALGMYVGFLPTWGDKWNQQRGVGPEIFTPEMPSDTASGSDGATRMLASCGSSAAIGRSKPRRDWPSSARWREGCAPATVAAT